jgi:multiple sugar transport system substrate-binding protein
VDDFNKTFLNLGMVDGTLQMLPSSGDVVILFINKKLVQQAGVEIPWTLDYKNNKLWTTDDFYKVCQRLTVDVKGKRGNEPGFDKSNVSVYGAAMPIDWWAVYVPALLSFGGQLVSDDLTKSTLNSKAGVDAFTWLTKPVLDGYWAPYSFLTPFGPTTNAQATGAFNASKVAITATVRGGIPGIRPNIKDDWDVAHFYAGPVKRVTGMGTQGFAMSGSTKNPNVAWDFLEFMYNQQGMQIITSSYGSTPVEQRFYNSSFWKNLPPPPSNNDVFTQAFDYGTLPPRLPFYTTGPFTKALLDGLTAIELGQSTPSQVVQSVSSQLQQWLDQNKKQ